MSKSRRLKKAAKIKESEEIHAYFREREKEARRSSDGSWAEFYDMMGAKDDCLCDVCIRYRVMKKMSEK